MAEFPLRVAIGSDHAGFPLKSMIADHFSTRVESLIDCGTTDAVTSCDYPDYAIAVAQEVMRGNVDKGIAICGSGVGVSITANKVKGIRAAICHDTYSAHQGVEHDDMNVLCLGGRIIGSELAFEIVAAYLGARFIDHDERFTRRLAKVLALEGIEPVTPGN